MTTLIMTVVALNDGRERTYRFARSRRSRWDCRGGCALRIEVARLSAPSRIARWAEDNDMRLPATDEVIPLRVAGADGGSA